MSLANQLFKPNGDGYDVAPAGVLLLCAGAVYGDPSETTPQGRERGAAVIDGILSAAHVGGYKQGDILRTLLARNQPSRRVIEMAQAACDAAGREAVVRIITQMGMGRS